MVPNIRWMKQNFDAFNQKYFGGQLSVPRFSVNNCPEGLWGCYDAGANTLSLTQVYSRPEHSVQEALLHEMIHMYIITVEGRTPLLGGHGPRFKSIAARINKDGWKITATTEMTDDDVLYQGERIPDEDDEGSPLQQQMKQQQTLRGNTQQNIQQSPNNFNASIQSMTAELNKISSKVAKLQKQFGINECKKLVISEEQEKALIKILKEESQKRSIDPQKVLILKKKLDEKFIPLDYEIMKGGDVKCIKIAGRLTPKTKQVIEKLYEEDLDDWAADVCKNMFLDEKDCYDFAKLVVNRWLNNKISVHGMLDVNYF